MSKLQEVVNISRPASILSVCALLAGTAPAGTPETPAQAASPTGGEEALLPVEALLDSAIQSAGGELVGEIRQLLLDPARGSIRTVIVDLLEPERRTVAVPWSYLAIGPNGAVSWAASEDELLRAPSYPPGQPGPSADAPTPAEDQSLVSYAPTEEIVDRFDPRDVATYRGVVIGTMTAPLQGRADDVVALIDVGEGAEVIAHLGPEFYLTQIGLNLTPGQAVVLEGSRSEVDERIVVVVSKISVQDRRFVLRNLDGTPLWTRPNLPPGKF